MLPTELRGNDPRTRKKSRENPQIRVLFVSSLPWSIPGSYLTIQILYHNSDTFLGTYYVIQHGVPSCQTLLFLPLSYI